MDSFYYLGNFENCCGLENIRNNKIYCIFSGFFPAAINFLRRLPVLSVFFSLPGIKNVRVVYVDCFRHLKLEILLI